MMKVRALALTRVAEEEEEEVEVRPREPEQVPGLSPGTETEWSKVKTQIHHPPKKRTGTELALEMSKVHRQMETGKGWGRLPRSLPPT
mgnify:CR=1 FL=1